jgi:hypothetical protein
MKPYPRIPVIHLLALFGRPAPDDEPVEQHAVRGYVQLGGRILQRPDIGGDVDRLDVDELADLVLLDADKEVARGPIRPCGCFCCGSSPRRFR